MFKLFSKMLKDQTGLGVIGILVIASLVMASYSLYSVGTKAQKAIDKKIELAEFAKESNTEDAKAYQEELQRKLTETAVEGGEVAVGIVAGVHDTYLVTSALQAARTFDPLKTETENLDNLDDAIKKTIEKKVELNSDSETTQQEKETIVEETMKIIQEAENNNTEVDLNSTIQDELKTKGKLADEKIIELRKVLKRNQLSYDYNNKILEKYEELMAEGQVINDTTEFAEAKRRLEIANEEIKTIEVQIEVLEDAKQATESTEETTATESTEETTPKSDKCTIKNCFCNPCGGDGTCSSLGGICSN